MNTQLLCIVVEIIGQNYNVAEYYFNFNTENSSRCEKQFIFATIHMYF